MIDIMDVEVGVSYACKFRATIMVDTEGDPAPNTNGTELSGTQEYTGIGVIKVRDVEQGLVQLEDTASGLEFVVPFADIWDIDTVEWTNSDASS
jgi:hypothetical protein